MTFNFIPWFLHSIYVTVISCDMLSMLFLENISFLCHYLKPSFVMTFDIIPSKYLLLCNCLKPSYVMTFDIIPVFFFHFQMQQRITSTSGQAQKKSWNNVDKIFLMLIWSKRLSMLIICGRRC